MPQKKKKAKDQEIGFELTEPQWAIMKVVWDNEPCSAGEVQEVLARTKDWAYSTVKTTMDRMVNKGLLEVKKIRNLQLFSSKVTKAQATKKEFRRMLKTVFDGALSPMMQYLLEHEKVSKDDIEQLRRMVEEADTKRRS